LDTLSSSSPSPSPNAALNEREDRTPGEDGAQEEWQTGKEGPPGEKEGAQLSDLGWAMPSLDAVKLGVAGADVGVRGSILMSEEGDSRVRDRVIV
jgi:hypothetical protein